MTKKLVLPSHEIVNGDTYQKLLTDPRFIAGLDEALRISNQSGYETSFDWGKIVGSPYMYPSDDIDVGDEISVGMFIGYDRIIKEFETETGESARDAKGNLREKVLYFDLNKEGKGESSTMPYPGWEENAERELKIDEFQYTFIDLHIHPGISSYPSRRDFNFLRWVKEGFSNANFFEKPLSPLGMIVAKKPNENNKHNITCLKGKFVSLQNFQMGCFIYGAKNVTKILQENGTSLVFGAYDSQTKEIQFRKPSDEGIRLVSPRLGLENFTYNLKINSDLIQQEMNRRIESRKKFERKRKALGNKNK